MTFSSAPLVDGRRPAALRRCWLFLPGADRGALLGASTVRADVLIQELEDFTPPERRPEARAMAAEIYSSWRAAGIVAAVRVNPLETEGRADLAAVMRGRPDVVIMSKVAEPAQVAALDEEVMRLERHFDIPPGTTEACAECRIGTRDHADIRHRQGEPAGHRRARLNEDVTADLGAPRSKNAVELADPRQRLHLECTAANVLSVDCPYTFADVGGCDSRCALCTAARLRQRRARSIRHVRGHRSGHDAFRRRGREARGIVEEAFEMPRDDRVARIVRGTTICSIELSS